MGNGQPVILFLGDYQMARLFLVGTAACFLLASALLHGDEKPKGDKTSAKPSLPMHFDRLGLTDDQKIKIMEVREDYSMKIKDLEEQIRELRKKERAAMEESLTDSQRARLRELRSEKAPGRNQAKPNGKE
jgi:Spy/CpxP family protein refolding chaperone